MILPISASQAEIIRATSTWPFSSLVGHQKPVPLRVQVLPLSLLECVYLAKSLAFSGPWNSKSNLNISWAGYSVPSVSFQKSPHSLSLDIYGISYFSYQEHCIDIESGRLGFNPCV
jgi:hypothetical protein